MSSLLVEQGWAALREGDAAGARSAFESALEEAGSGEVLEGLAQSLYFEREYTAAAIHYERAYAAYREERDALAAGRAARAIAWITGNVFGDWAVHSGWLARAQTVLEEAGENQAEAACSQRKTWGAFSPRRAESTELCMGRTSPR